MQYIIVAVLYTVVWITERRNPTIMLGSGGGRGRGGECARSVSYSGYSSMVSRYTTNFITIERFELPKVTKSYES